MVIHPYMHWENCRLLSTMGSMLACSQHLLLDLRAAFDTVWHDALLYKMNELRFPAFLIKTIQSFLHIRYGENVGWHTTRVGVLADFVQHISVRFTTRCDWICS